MINTVTLTGRLTADPEIRVSQAGKKNASFTLVVDRAFKNAQGQKEADFIRCKAFGTLAEKVIEPYLRKGDMCGIVGRIKTGSYQNQQGQKVYTTDVIVNELSLLGGNKNQNQPQQQAPQGGYSRQQTPQQNAYGGGYQQNASYGAYGGGRATVAQDVYNHPAGGYMPQTQAETLDIADDDLPF